MVALAVGGFNVQTTYTHNRRRLLTGESSSNGPTLFTLGYGYNANAHLSRLTYPDGQVVGYAPDPLGRTKQVAVVDGQTYASAVSYYPTGAISGFTYGNQIAHSMTPNIRQLPGRSWDVYGGTTVLDDTYAYDANGNVDYITDALPESATSHTRDLGYDDLDRLVVADSPNAVWGQATYSYDPLDNLRTVTIANQTGTTRSHFYNYNAATNQLISISGPTGHGAYGFTYDSRGNTTWKNVGTANCAAYPVLQCVGKVPQSYVFDRANRLSQVTGVQTYRYDGLGRRVQTTDADGKTTFWMYSQSGQVLFSSEARRSQNISYIYLGNTQVATRTVAWGTGTTTVRYQHTDALGSPVVETDAGRNVIKRNVFSPWGEAWGTTVVDGTGYTGHVMDAGTGLTYMKQRYYDPVLGRFLSIDPVATDSKTGGNFNRYWYAADNPYRFTDPDGRLAMGNGHKENRNDLNGGPTEWENFVASISFSSGDKEAKVDSNGKVTLAIKDAVTASIGPNGLNATIGGKGVTFTYDDKGNVKASGPAGIGTLTLGGRIGQGISSAGYTIKGASVILQSKGNGVVAYTFKVSASLGPINYSRTVASNTFSINPIRALDAAVPEIRGYRERFEWNDQQQQQGNTP